MRILGIETSCDETAIAVVDENGAILAERLSSQVAAHQPYGGVVPEIAARHHLAAIPPLLAATLDAAGLATRDLTAVAVTAGPGLIGALLVGVSFAKAFAWGLGVPLVGINHLEGHVFSPFLDPAGGPARSVPQRFLALVVSGGHASAIWIEGENATTLNRTRDDAPGEVFDKIAKRLGLPYPGGPVIDALAERGDRTAYRFAIPSSRNVGVDYSFSGLKSAVLREIERLEAEGLLTLAGDDPESWPGRAFDLLASFEEAVCDMLFERLEKLKLPARAELLGLGGGVAANRRLRERAAAWGVERGISVLLPHRRFTTDNAAMIAFAGLRRLRRGESAAALGLDARARWDVGEPLVGVGGVCA